MHARNVTNLLGIVVNVNTNNSDDICSNTSVPCRQAIAAAFCSREKIMVQVQFHTTFLKMGMIYDIYIDV